MTDGDPPLWTIELTLIPSAVVIGYEAKDALRGIKARRRKGNPMTCCCCTTMLGAAPFILVMGRDNDDVIPQAEAGVCRRCGPDVDEAGGKAARIVRRIWPGLVGYELATIREGDQARMRRRQA